MYDMDAVSRKNREDIDRDVEFSYAIKAGKRIYYMDVRRTRKDDLYLSITESKKIVPADGNENAVPSFEKHKIFLYKEDFSKFIDGLSKAIGYIHEKQPREIESLAADEAGEEQTPGDDGVESIEEFKIDF